MIDYNKRFDTVRYEHLSQPLQFIDVDAQVNKLLNNLYWNQQASVRHNGYISKTIDIKQFFFFRGDNDNDKVYSHI